MKFLVLGCNGMAGHMISLYLKEQGHQVWGFARRSSPFVQTVVGDARDTTLLESTLRDGDFDSVVNCIGVLNRAAEENKADAAFLNGYLPHALVRMAEGTKSQIVHISTDCVFSGDRGRYTETDLRDGTSFYARSKALGEVEEAGHVTLRQSIVGPDLRPEGIGLMNWFLQQKGPVNGYTQVMWTGLTTLQLAKTVETAARERLEGLYNVVPDRSISKYDLLELFNRYLRAEKVTIRPYDQVREDKSLVRTRGDADLSIPDYEKMVIELADWMRAHRDLYLQYDLA